MNKRLLCLALMASSLVLPSARATEIVAVPYSKGVVIASEKRVVTQTYEGSFRVGRTISDGAIKINAGRNQAIFAAGHLKIGIGDNHSDIIKLTQGWVENHAVDVLSEHTHSDFATYIVEKSRPAIDWAIERRIFQPDANGLILLFDVGIVRFVPETEDVLTLQVSFAVELEKGEVVYSAQPAGNVIKLPISRNANTTAFALAVGTTSPRYVDLSRKPFPQTKDQAARLAASEIRESHNARQKLGTFDVGDTCDICVIDETGSWWAVPFGTKLSDVINGNVKLGRQNGVKAADESDTRLRDPQKPTTGEARKK